MTGNLDNRLKRIETKRAKANPDHRRWFTIFSNSFVSEQAMNKHVQELKKEHGSDIFVIKILGVGPDLKPLYGEMNVR